MSDTQEPWLRGTHTEGDAVIRAVLHALELADEDIAKWCAALTDAEFNERASIACSATPKARSSTPRKKPRSAPSSTAAPRATLSSPSSAPPCTYPPHAFAPSRRTTTTHPAP